MKTALLMTSYPAAHHYPLKDENGTLHDVWEPLFTPDCATLDARRCPACEALEPLHGHLNKVAYLCRCYAESMFGPASPEAEWVRSWASQMAWWHDLGKFAPDWQRYLQAKVDVHGGECAGKLDHSTAGAKHISALPHFGPLFAYLIAGHHGGLPDGIPLFDERLQKPLAAWEDAARAAGLPLEAAVSGTPPRKDIWSYALLARMLFSCLVDADFLATESFMDPSRTAARPRYPEDVLVRMEGCLRDYYNRFCEPAPGDVVNQQRAHIRKACLAAAERDPGFFSLTVPTGGGKTLASLAFALAHARKHGLRRVIYVIPYTSIIEQNADVFREVFAPLEAELGRPVVLEHHSNFDPKDQATGSRNRLMAENWDAPLVVTTNVQFFESLFADKPSKCRKLHRIARSVVIFDEVQSLPVNLLSPILKSLQALANDLGVSPVFCTATQPALTRREKFAPGIPPEAIREIVPDPVALFQILKRVETRNLGRLSVDELCDRVASEAADGALLIVNTTKAARELCDRLSPEIPTLHLSARMCPAHRTQVLAEAKTMRGPRVLVATKLIEAGVDISFPVMFRAECGLDSFAQAAGRCNRNGELRDASGQPALGRAYYCELPDYPLPSALHDLVVSAGVTRAHILPLYGDDLLSLEAIDTYFRQAIWQQGPPTNDWDSGKGGASILQCFGGRGPKAFQAFAFKQAAEAFRLIDSPAQPVLIPWAEAGEQLREEIVEAARFGRLPHPEHYRRAQRYSVNVFPHELAALQRRLETYFDGAFTFLTNPSADYDDTTGLIPASGQERAEGFIA